MNSLCSVTIKLSD